MQWFIHCFLSNLFKLWKKRIKYVKITKVNIVNNYNELLINLPKIHTTELGYKRIKNNLNIGDSDVVNYCRNLINDCNCEIVRIGKNWYCKLNNICITVNAYSFTIITAHIIK